MWIFPGPEIRHFCSKWVAGEASAATGQLVVTAAGWVLLELADARRLAEFGGQVRSC
jgi:hypothetical protein